jgi:hypothetical protein
MYVSTLVKPKVCLFPVCMNNLILFYYLSASEICPDKRGGLWWEWPCKKETTAHLRYYIILLVEGVHMIF